MMNKLATFLFLCLVLVSTGGATPPDFTGTSPESPLRIVDVFIPRVGHLPQTLISETGAVANNVAVTTTTLTSLTIETANQPTYDRALIILQEDDDDDDVLLVNYVIKFLSKAGDAGDVIQYSVSLRGTATYVLPLPVSRLVSITYQADAYQASDVFDIGYRGFFPYEFWADSRTTRRQVASVKYGVLGTSSDYVGFTGIGTFPQDGEWIPPTGIAVDDSIVVRFYSPAQIVVPRIYPFSGVDYLGFTYRNY